MAFESKDTGKLDKITETRLKHLLGKYNHSVKIVFVSACHSEMIGNLFERL